MIPNQICYMDSANEHVGYRSIRQYMVQPCLISKASWCVLDNVSLFFFETALIFNTRESLLPTRCVAAFSHQQGFMVCDWLCFHSCEAAFTHTHAHIRKMSFLITQLDALSLLAGFLSLHILHIQQKQKKITVLHHGHDLYVRWVVKFSICIFFFKCYSCNVVLAKNILKIGVQTERVATYQIHRWRWSISI